MLNWPKPIAEESRNETISRVFSWAYGIFDWTADIQSWGVPEHWPLRSELEEHAAINDGRVKDDCDGFAILCRCALWDLSVANRILICNVEPSAAPRSPGGNHAVLTVDGTGLVLDCRQSIVRSREELERIGYQWVSLSGLTPWEPWTEVKP